MYRKAGVLGGHPLKAEFGAPNSLLAKSKRQRGRGTQARVYNGFQPKVNTVVCLTKARYFYFGEASLLLSGRWALGKKASGDYLLIQEGVLTIPTFQILNVRFSVKIFAKNF